MASKKPWSAFALAMVLMANLLPLAAALPNLRIMPLGDSITKGSGSSGIVGYRGPLRRKLLSQGKDDGITVDMIGSLTDGNMPDNNHEGHSGRYLDEINTYWKLSIKARPNLVLIHAGTNNMDKNRDLDIALDIYRNMIDGIFTEAPEVTILIAPIIWANKPAMQVNTDHFNPQLEALIKLRQQQGKRILPVPIDIGPGDLWDEKHPNDQGYEKMANAWLKAILEADSRGYLKKPVAMTDDDAPNTGIGNSADGGSEIGGSHGKIWEKKGTIFEGFRTWETVGTIAAAAENGSRDKLILADLNGDGISDYVLADNDGTVRAWINSGKPNSWTSLGKVNPSWSSIKGDMVRMADVDNDGKADLIVLYSDGAAKVWKNIDNGKKFEALDSKWATGLASSEKVHFEDIDGDGYADYVIVYSGGGVRWARNTHNNGKDSSKKNWENDEAIAPGPAGMPDNRARIRDIDGDGKSDYLVVYDGGAVKAWRNTIGDGGTDNNWADLGTIAPGVSGVTGNMIRFADMDGDGLPDFLAVADDGSIRMWKNLGIAGTKGASLRFADLTGDGKDDIISVDAKGRARAWTNKGVDKWESMGEIAPGLDEDLSSARIEFADVNGDKKADYLVIYGGGAVKAYLNNGNLPNPGNSRIWQNPITLSPGVGEPGSKVRFADLNGDGFDDFLILYDGGAVKCWLNNKNVPPKGGERIWGEGQIVATGVGEPGSKIRFADLTGDGKADYIVQYDGGAAKAYRNLGKIGTSQSGRKWSLIGTVATGVSPQGPVYYADINGDKKADYLVAFDGGAVNAYINSYDWIPDEGEDDGKDDDDEDDNDNDTNKCTPAPKTYSKKQIDRVGEYMDWEKMEWTNSAIVGVQYVTIVNLTPHKFIYDVDGSNSYQMTNWDFADIPQGKARQNAVEYSSTAGNKVDSKGEAYYSIDGTRDKFVVRVTNHEFALYPKRIVFDLNDMGAGSREYNCPQVETPVTLVITGSADYEHGYITSLVHGGAGWMQSIKDVIKDRRLNEIVIPGTHDAGMTRISNGLLSLGSADNTQTQNLNIKGQLEAGSRWFDLRIASVHKPGNDNYDFWAIHVNKELGNPAIGAAGEKLSEVIDEINEFTSKNPGEVIILQTRALMGLYQSPRGPILWDDGLKEDFFDKLRRINNRCPNLNHENSFETYKMGTLMGQNKGKGCVLIFLNTGNLEEKIEEKDRISEKDGIYNKDSMKLTDAWPNKKNTEDMAEWAVTEWKKEKTDMYIGQWVVTANYAPGGETRSILQTSVLATNPALYWRGVNEMSPTAFPNVLLVDYIGNVLLNVNEPDWDDLSAEMQVLAIGLNLYMISENCKINSQRPPLLPRDSKSSRLASGRGKAKSWNGVVFANGTRFDQPISGRRLGCSKTLLKGTVFENGTVLDRDVPNPRCQPVKAQAPNATLPSFTPTPRAIRRRKRASLSVTA
ncbi:SGNH-hydro domain-containing protein [Fusarium keratoplasticum]|uniref:SGNH-hydro domain-containing protein n=1 Tax=Fusarium keratoplasticum TaxID=1328300 RepID=A0ACC0R1F9_9HYPO|nr:SGNH-hydro domain-containing protein [Fusarium keratoplasticum]KAI8671681.1 SGNH-hydro domain-containing protein [Fusarium keratoplasticum]